MRTNIAIIVPLVLITLAACSAPPTATPPRAAITRSPSARQFTPTSLPSAATATRPPALATRAEITSTRILAVNTPTQLASSGRLPLPTGAPAANWHDFPIMPNAIAGQDNNKGGYYYSVRATPRQIQEFYDREMKKLGWDLLTAGTKADDPGYLLLVYFQANYPTLTALISVQGEVTVVFLAN